MLLKDVAPPQRTSSDIYSNMMMKRRHIAISTAALAATFLLYLFGLAQADKLTFEAVLEKARALL